MKHRRTLNLQRKSTTQGERKVENFSGYFLEIEEIKILYSGTRQVDTCRIWPDEVLVDTPGKYIKTALSPVAPLI